MCRRPRLVRFAIALWAAPLLLWLVGGRALAAPPTNDTFPNATAVALGFSETIDTTEATTDADDAQVNTFCGAPATDASVWYTFTATEDSGVVIDVSGSDYSAGIIVSLGNLAGDLVACGPGTVSFFAAAGTTYYVLAFDDQFDGVGTGGNLSISFNEVPPTTLDFSVNRSGLFNAETGTATISGTYTCSGGSYVEVYGDVRQQVGRIATILGYFYVFEFDTCDGEPHAWSAEVFPQSGLFKGGKALTVSYSYTCGPFQCANGYVEQTVQLSGGGKKASSAALVSPQLFLPSITTSE